MIGEPELDPLVWGRLQPNRDPLEIGNHHVDDATESLRELCAKNEPLVITHVGVHAFHELTELCVTIPSSQRFNDPEIVVIGAKLRPQRLDLRLKLGNRSSTAAGIFALNVASN